jgi:hypothetical protein
MSEVRACANTWLARSMLMVVVVVLVGYERLAGTNKHQPSLPTNNSPLFMSRIAQHLD